MKRFYSSRAEPNHRNAMLEKTRPMYSSRAEQILSNAMLEIKRRKLASKENDDKKDTTQQNIPNSKTTKKRLIFDQVTQFLCPFPLLQINAWTLSLPLCYLMCNPEMQSTQLKRTIDDGNPCLSEVYGCC